MEVAGAQAASTRKATGFTYQTNLELSIEDQVSDVVVQAMKFIVEGSQCLLSKGCWYPVRYYEALGEGNPQRRNTLQTNGNFFHGYLPGAFFSHSQLDSPARCASPTGKITEFVVKPRKSSSEALDAILTGLALVDCSNVCQIVHYVAIRTLIGSEKFDKLFQDRLMIGDYSSHPENPLMTFLVPCHDRNYPSVKAVMRPGLIVNDPIFGERSLSEEQGVIPVGARVIFTNIEHYTMKHSIGSSASMNVICVDNTPGKELYYAYGISREPVSANQILTYLMESYNKAPSDGAHLNEPCQKWYRENRARYGHLSSDKVTIELFLQKRGGFEPFSGKALNTRLIKQIQKMDLEDLSWEAISKL
ncbi:MAG: hypothetical protein H7A41_04690 [Chlamydiales bacterium]|nr:hypothetical protein [Chlamydiales bacterium]